MPLDNAMRRAVDRTAARIRRFRGITSVNVGLELVNRQDKRFVLVRQDGRELEPWEVRAGMVVTGTVYNHEDRTVTAVVR